MDNIQVTTERKNFVERGITEYQERKVKHSNKSHNCTRPFASTLWYTKIYWLWVPRLLFQL